ncbi:fungal pheromone mating factor STE2 GPCR-domain-containing protein [Dipodascopsis uninucleata]
MVAEVQTSVLLTFDGEQYTIPSETLNEWMHVVAEMTMVFGIHLGSAGIIAIMLALLTKPNKRRTPVFILNEICLVLLCLRAGLYINYALGPFTTFVHMFTDEIADISHQTYVRSAVTTVIPFFIQLFIELSLIFQVRVVFDTHRRLQKIVTICCGLFSTLVMGFYLAAIVQSVQAIMADREYSQRAWVYVTAKILYAVSISLFSAIFCFKLVLAIRQRRVLGLREFGPLQVILIMTTQTMIVPSVLTIVEVANNFGASYSTYYSLVTLYVVLSLPLSAMWASATNDAIASSRRSGTNSNNNVTMSNGSSQPFAFKNHVSQASSEDLDLEKHPRDSASETDTRWPGSGNITVTRTIVTDQ